MRKGIYRYIRFSIDAMEDSFKYIYFKSKHDHFVKLINISVSCILFF